MELISKLKEKANQLKAESQVLMLAYQDKRTPFFAKILIWITVAYLVSPIDLIPDFIPVIGLLDDIIIVPILISLSIKQIPKVVMNEARERAKTTPHIVKKGSAIFGAVVMSIWLTLFYSLIYFLLKYLFSILS